MSENAANNKSVRDDEIDLLDLFRRMGNGISRMGSAIGRGILITIVFMLRHWLVLGLSVLLGLGTAYLLKYTAPSFYTSDLVLRTNTVPASDLISYVNRLHTYCIERNTPALTNAISVSQAQMRNIIDISAYWIIDKGADGYPDEVDLKNRHNIYDTLNVRMQDRLNIRVRINEPQELVNIRDGIIKYISSDSLFQQRNRLRIRQNQTMLARLDYDILQLDSLQKVKYFEETRSMQPKGGGQMIFLQQQTTQLIIDDIYSLYTKKQNLEAERDLYSGLVTVLSDFSIPALRDNGGGYYAIRTVPIFFFLALLILIIFANRRKLVDVYNRY